MHTICSNVMIEGGVGWVESVWTCLIIMTYESIQVDQHEGQMKAIRIPRSHINPAGDLPRVDWS